MNSVLWFSISILCVSISASSYKIEENGQFRSNSSIYIDCFDVFIPLINRLSNDAKEISKACVASADAQKERESVSMNRTRSELFSEVKRIKETLSTCSTQKDHFGYFECLKGIIEIDRKVVAEITMKSSNYSNRIGEIEEQQTKCFRNSVSKIKEKSSTAIYSLQTCLTSGETLGASDKASSRASINNVEHPTTTTPFHSRRLPYNMNWTK